MYGNVEKSGFRRGEYVGYGPLGTYRIRKIGRRHWRADLRTPMAGGVGFHGVTGGTLRFISERIAAGGN